MKFLFVCILFVGGYLFGRFSTEEDQRQIVNVASNVEERAKKEFRTRAKEYCSELEITSYEGINCSTQFAECQEANLAKENPLPPQEKEDLSQGYSRPR